MSIEDKVVTVQINSISWEVLNLSSLLTSSNLLVENTKSTRLFTFTRLWDRVNARRRSELKISIESVKNTAYSSVKIVSWHINISTSKTILFTCSTLFIIE